MHFNCLVLFQAIQFSISTQFSSIWPIDWTPSGATSPGESGPGSNYIEEVLCILQSSSIIHHQIVSCLIPDTRLGVSYFSAEKLLVYFTAPVD